MAVQHTQRIGLYAEKIFFTSPSLQLLVGALTCSQREKSKPRECTFVQYIFAHRGLQWSLSRSLSSTTIIKSQILPVIVQHVVCAPAGASPHT